MMEDAKKSSLIVTGEAGLAEAKKKFEALAGGAGGRCVLLVPEEELMGGHGAVTDAVSAAAGDVIRVK